MLNLIWIPQLSKWNLKFCSILIRASSSNETSLFGCFHFICGGFVCILFVIFLAQSNRLECWTNSRSGLFQGQVRYLNSLSYLQICACYMIEVAPLVWWFQWLHVILLDSSFHLHWLHWFLGWQSYDSKVCFPQKNGWLFNLGVECSYCCPHVKLYLRS